MTSYHFATSRTVWFDATQVAPMVRLSESERAINYAVEHGFSLATPPIAAVPVAPMNEIAIYGSNRVSMNAMNPEVIDDEPIRVWKTYSAEFADTVCDLIADGDCLASIARMPGFPTRLTIRRWMARHPQFELAYHVARRDRADARSDAIDGVSQDLLAGKIDPDIARVVINALKWQASKENVSRYGDKLEQTITATLPMRKPNAIDWNDYNVIEASRE